MKNIDEITKIAESIIETGDTRNTKESLLWILTLAKEQTKDIVRINARLITVEEKLAKLEEKVG